VGAGWKRFSGNGGMVWRVDADDGPEHASLVSPPVIDDGSGRLVLSFDQRYRTYSRDGGVVEASTDDGATWIDVGTGAVPGYTGTVWGDDYPDTARSGFTGESRAYPRYERIIVDLGDRFRGRTVRFRFRFAVRSGYQSGYFTWDVDNVSITGVQSHPFPRRSPNTRTCLLADAGPDVTTDAYHFVELDGRGSHAYPGEVLSYTWTQVAGPPVDLTTDGAVASFSTEEADEPVELRFRLLVHSDARAADATDEVSVFVRQGIVVDIGDDRDVASGAEVVFTGRAVGWDRDVFSYRWFVSGVPESDVRGADTPTLRFTAPAVTSSRSIFVSLMATSSTRPASGSASARIRVHPPLALAPTAAPRIAVAGQVVRLRSGVNRSVAHALRWSQSGGPAAAIADAAASTAEVTLPASPVHAALQFRVEATSVELGDRASADTSVVLVAASAGDDRQVTGGDEVTLGVAQPDELVPGVAYAWRQAEGPDVELTGRDGAVPRFRAPAVASATTLAFALTVTVRDTTITATDEVAVTVTPAAPPPPIDAGDAGAPPDAGVPDAGAPTLDAAPTADATSPAAMPSDGGCGCRTGGAGGGPTGVLVALAMVLVRARRSRAA